MKIATIVGARPQFIKASALSAAIEKAGLQECLIHTGQHFDANMSDVFFEEMDIRRPDHHLGIAGGGHGAMTGRMLEAIEQVLVDETPDWVVVYGDTNSTLAGALAASKLHIPIGHVEAGLRSFNRAMPEEINRVVADHVADVLFAPTDTAVANLHKEGIPESRIQRTGDVMFDVIRRLTPRAEAGAAHLRSRVGVEPGGYVLATVHRAENTDCPVRLEGIMKGLATIGWNMPVVLPLHPRTRAALERHGLNELTSGIKLIDPVGYLDMLALQSGAAVIATDSGGLQKEAYCHGVPCLTLRDETEWVELIEVGANQLVGADTDAIVAGYENVIGTDVAATALYGDGHAAEAILNHLTAHPVPSPNGAP